MNSQDVQFGTDPSLTALFCFAVVILMMVMKLVALLEDRKPRPTRWLFLIFPVPSPESLKRAPPASALPAVLIRGFLHFLLLALFCFLYVSIKPSLAAYPWLLGYFAAPILMVVGEVGFCAISFLWTPSGRLLPYLHNLPPLASSVSDFWGNRWNLWFSDWFRSAIFKPLRRRPIFALFLVFFVSGLMHEWVLNFPFYFVFGKNLFGTMMLYFLLQFVGILIERRYLHSPLLRRLWFWLIAFLPAPLVLNEPLLRVLLLWP